MVFRLHEKEALVRRGHHFAIAGLALLALTILGVLIVVTNFLFTTAVVVVMCVLYVITVTTLWVLLPLESRRNAARRAGR
jgi:uncharacterized membrane protein YqjE